MMQSRSDLWAQYHSIGPFDKLHIIGETPKRHYGMDQLISMRAFVRATELGGFASAAQDLGISPTMVGLHVRELENRLGSRLLNRTTRRQSLTEVGRLYYERCRQILLDIEDADRTASQLRAAPRGRLRVNAPVSYGVHALTPVIAEYLAAYPEVEVDLTVNDRVIDLVEEGIEVAVRVGVLADSGLIARPLAPYQLMICASPDYLAKFGQPRKPADLARHNCLAFDRWGAPHVWTFENGESAPVRGVLRTNNGEALRVAALRGLGIIQQPRVLVADDIHSGRLVRVLSDYELPSRPMHLVYLPDRRPTPKLRTFIDFVLARLGLSG
jgi:DNA-binding transcriptional LysR family regulator